MPDTTSTTTANARAAFTAKPPVASLNTSAARPVLRRAILAAQNGLPR